VTLEARDVSVRDILHQWAEVGHTTVLNGEKIQGGPVSFQLLDVPERLALETVLRGVSGYILAERQTPSATSSTFDRILILPVSTPPRIPAPAPVTAPFVAQRPGLVGPGAVRPQGAFADPRGTAGLQPDGSPVTEVGEESGGVGLQGMPPPLQDPGATPGQIARPAALIGSPPMPVNPANAPLPPVTVSPGNPFGIPRGSGQPGVVTPPPPPAAPVVTSPSETLRENQ
jgi:hypothetical protein